ncbi:hypothetical protein GmHk_18G050983 [Glycine max]|nr:hypothetical protein GmHk_18G050983 [Glycine max]
MYPFSLPSYLFEESDHLHSPPHLKSIHIHTPLNTMENGKAFVILFTLLLGSVQIKYTEPGTNPFLSTPTMSLFVASITCHGLASMAADTNLQALIIFYMSGIVGCEVLVWVLLADIFWYSMVNMLASIVAFLCFFNDILKIFADHEMQPPEEEV